jgi:hypothetical protein
MRPAAKAIATAAAIKPFVVADILLCAACGAFLTGEVLARAAVVAGVAVAAVAVFVVEDSELEAVASFAVVAVASCFVSSETAAVDCTSVVIASVASVGATFAPQLGQLYWPANKVVPHSLQVFIKQLLQIYSSTVTFNLFGVRLLSVLY